MDSEDKIDFVVLWVDGSDPNWVESRNRYMPERLKDLNHESRYRDWGIFKYWFRAVEKYAPWVNKIHLVTADQKPSWLNDNHPKLNLVSHSDFMDKDYLPTFSTRPIELNLHRIPGLSERFVYFNDDMFLFKPVSKEDFFYKGLPRDYAIRNPLSGSDYSYALFNSLNIIENNFKSVVPHLETPSNWFNLRYGSLVLRNILLLPWKKHVGFYYLHAPVSYLKSDFKAVWHSEGDYLSQACLNKFRSKEDVNQQLIRWWRLVKNKFYPLDVKRFSKEVVLDEGFEASKVRLLNRYGTVCFNDSESTSFERTQAIVTNLLKEKFVCKSEFER